MSDNLLSTSHFNRLFSNKTGDSITKSQTNQNEILYRVRPHRCLTFKHGCSPVPDNFQQQVGIDT